MGFFCNALCESTWVRRVGVGTAVILTVIAFPHAGQSRTPSTPGVSFHFGRPTATPTPTPANAPAPAVARPNLPFKSRVVAVDRAHSSFRIGKKKVRVIHVLPDTKLFKGDGTTPAVFSDIVIGVEVRGSLHRTDKGGLEAVSLKIGLKTNPAASKEAEGDALP